jgi:hypothetical protein
VLESYSVCLDDARDRLASEFGAAARELPAKIDRLDGSAA